IIRSGGVRLDLGHNGLDEITAVDFRIQAIGWETPDRARDERQALLRIYRRLELRQHDERGARLIQPRLHSGGDFHPSGERKANVDAVAHLVGFERAPNLGDDLLVGWNPTKSQSLGR